MKSALNNLKPYTVAGLYNNTKSDIRYSELEKKDKEIRESDEVSKTLDRELREKKEQLMKYKKSRNEPKKGITSNILGSITRGLGMTDDDKKSMDELEEKMEKEGELLKIASSRNCNSAVVAGFYDLLDTCAKKHLIETYNTIIKILKRKKFI